MRLIVLASSLTLRITSANIIFPYIQPTCHYEPEFSRCLRGQECTTNNTCVPVDITFRREEATAALPRSDGRCGFQFRGASCDPEGPFGGCCSQHGWCGKTPMHCLQENGCQSGCAADPTKSAGVSISESAIGVATSTISTPAAASRSVTTDGTCGAGKGNTVCGNWPQGSCCSM